MASGRCASAISIMVAISVTSAGWADSGQVIEAEYRCQGGQTILARYDNTDPNAARALLTIQGKQFNLRQAVSGSGARYTSEQGLKPGTGIEWWIKGDDATLGEVLLDATAPTSTPISTCTAKAQ